MTHESRVEDTYEKEGAQFDHLNVCFWLLADIRGGAPESPLYPRKQTFKRRNPDSDLWMSALPPKADIRRCKNASVLKSGHWMSAYPPIADVIGCGAECLLFTHLRH